MVPAPYPLCWNIGHNTEGVRTEFARSGLLGRSGCGAPDVGGLPWVGRGCSTVPGALHFVAGRWALFSAGVGVITENGTETRGH